MSRLSQSVGQVSALVANADLADVETIRDLLELTTQRRRLDLSDLSLSEQAELVASRSQELQPSLQALVARMEVAEKAGRPFVAKFGIDPTGHEVHLGHAVPMLVLSRFQRMGHQVVFIVGDMTAKIGDPSGRNDERPQLTDEDIAENLATYRDQVTPFFDFERALFRHNGDWLSEVTLPRMTEILSRIPVSMSLQRDDFRKRLDDGHGLSLAELLYSVVMALDSVETACDLEVGGIDQFLNMQMCRRVMEICDQEPELVFATPLIEGTDGTGAKMSKSRGNYVSLTASAGEVFGKLMSVPDRLVPGYLAALSELQDSEIELLTTGVAAGRIHPMDLKKFLAGEITASLYGVVAAMQAREEFVARFSARRYAAAGTLPKITNLSLSVVDVLKSLGFARSNGEVRRIAQQDGLRIIVETPRQQRQVTLSVQSTHVSLADVLQDSFGDETGDFYLKLGRKLARIAP